MGKILDVHMEEELQRSYIDYAMSVIIGRAIPDVKDGLKPVQRRILYGMYRIGNTSSQPTKKSARVVGEIMGKYHPHGDIAIYDAIARMAQDFSMNHTLIEGQGNMGSIDGDPPAAMRYTEVRLTKFAEEIISDIDKETVAFVPNFDNTESEPTILPSKVPNLLINGASGIAVGVATSMLPHNLGEVCDAVLYTLKKPEASVEEVMSIIKGPDFPTGGIAIMSSVAYEGYRYGRGQVVVRAKAETENGNIIIKEIPYGVNKSNLLRGIIDAAKAKKVQGITDVRDESDKSGIRISIEIRKDADHESILNALYKYTQLEVTIPINNLAVTGKNLKSFNILQLIGNFIDFRREIIKKRGEYELKVAAERKEIIDGLIIAVQNIEEVVKTIKSSGDPAEAKGRLVQSYQLSERQASAILEMKLGRLTHLEQGSLETEAKELSERIAYYKNLISSPQEIDNTIAKELSEVKEKYGRKRRTEVVISETIEETTEEDTISNEPTTVIFTEAGYIKRLSPENYKEQSRGGKGMISINLKENDYVKQIIKCYTKDTLLCITDKGNAQWLKAYRIPEGSRYAEGKAIVNLLDLRDEHVIFVSSVSDFSNSKILFLTRKGIIKKVAAAKFSRPRATGIKAIALADGDTVADVSIYETKKYILIASAAGKLIKFEEQSLRAVGRAAMGVRGIRLAQGDEAINILAAEDHGYVLSVTQNGYGKLTEIGKYRTQRRGGKGTINLKVNQKTGNIAKVLLSDGNEEVTLINSGGVAISFKASDIRITGRAASGVRLMRMDSKVKVVGAILNPVQQ